MCVTYDVLFELVKTVLHELKEEIEKGISGNSIAYFEGVTRTISDIFACLLINNCKPSQRMQGLLITEWSHTSLRVWLKNM
jgi:hypothetical protein